MVVISKSGTTAEPALAFRIIKKFMQEQYSAEDLKKRIICITDPHEGALRAIARKAGYRTFPIDGDIGGRFSVLTAAGLVPLAIAGIDIKGLIQGRAPPSGIVRGWTWKPILPISTRRQVFTLSTGKND